MSEAISGRPTVPECVPRGHCLCTASVWLLCPFSRREERSGGQAPHEMSLQGPQSSPHVQPAPRAQSWDKGVRLYESAQPQAERTAPSPEWLTAGCEDSFSKGRPSAPRKTDGTGPVASSVKRSGVTECSFPRFCLSIHSEDNTTTQSLWSRRKMSSNKTHLNHRPELGLPHP